MLANLYILLLYIYFSMQTNYKVMDDSGAGDVELRQLIKLGNDDESKTPNDIIPDDITPDNDAVIQPSLDTNDNNDEIMHEHDEHSHDVSQINAWKIHVFMVQYPILSFLISLGMFIVCGILIAILASQGLLLNFTAQVPVEYLLIL